jgi:DNA repair photolyase
VSAGGNDRLLEYLGPCCTWVLRTYRKCAHRCAYCNTWAQGSSSPVLPQPEIIDALRRELAEVPSDQPIVVGPPSDGYPPAEKRHGVTRAVVEELLRQGRTVLVVTKGTTVARDADLFAAAGDRACVHVSLCAVDDAALRRLEPGAPTARARLALVRRLRAAGVRVQVDAAPWIPGVSDARALLAAVPAEVVVQFGPLDLSHLNITDPLGIGRTFTQREIDAAYLEERARSRADVRAKWLYPVGESGAEHDITAYMPPLPGHATPRPSGRRRGSPTRRVHDRGSGAARRRHASR